MGKKLPFLLQQAGFADIQAETQSWWSSFL
jgi:hypothetical protein